LENEINLEKPPVIDLDAFAQDFVNTIASREGKSPPRVNLVVVPDDQWDQLLEVTAPYRLDPKNIDRRVGVAFAVKQPMSDSEIPDLVKTLFTTLAEAMKTADLVVLLNQETLTHPRESDPERAFNSTFNNIVSLCEKGLGLLGYTNLNPITDSLAFINSHNPDHYISSM
jgi:hypothetical protein